MRRVDDSDDAGRSLHPLDASQHDVGRDAFLEGVRAQGEHAGEIDELDDRVTELRVADVFFDGDAGIVTGPLTQAGQAIEEGALAGVRVADDCDGSRWMAAY